MLFVQVKGHGGNHHHDAADALALARAAKPAVTNFIPTVLPPMTTRTPPPVPLGPKVSVQRLAKPTIATPPSTNNADAHQSALTAHCGRPKVIAKQLQLRKKLLEAKTEKEFWQVAKDIMGTKTKTGAFSAETLKDTFQTRMNPIEVQPHLGCHYARSHC